MTITAEQAAKLLEGTTPGPWIVETEAEPEGNFPKVYVCHSETVCDVTTVCNLLPSSSASVERRTANARLIAAAPDLARALIASEAARKLAEKRLAEAKLAYENVDAQVEDEGEFTERSWEQLRAILKETDND